MTMREKMVVTDDMVERAHNAHKHRLGMGRAAIRHALEAALNAPLVEITEEPLMPMREKIARAMFDKSNWIAQPGLVGTWNDRGREKWLAIADAALDALMEPSYEQLQAFMGWMLNKDFDPKMSEIDLYKMMIRAAKEGK